MRKSKPGIINRKKRTEGNLWLSLLSNFLNFDFGSGSEESLRKARLKVFELAQPGWRERGDELQKWFWGHLKHLIDREPKEKSTGKGEKALVSKRVTNKRWWKDTEYYLEQLLDEINDLDLKYRWFHAPGFEEIIGDPDPKDPYNKTLPGTERKRPNPELKKLGPDHGIVKIQGEKFIVFKQLSHETSAKERFCGFLIEALESGEFSRLRRCPECQRFFVAPHLNQEYCSPECQKKHDNKIAGAQRMADFRKRQAEAIKKKGVSKLSKLAKELQASKARTFEDLLEQNEALSEIRYKLGQNWEVFKPIVEQIWGDNLSVKKIWPKLPQRIKLILANLSLSQAKISG